MELVVQLLLAGAVFGITLSGGSLVWPRVSSAPRPQFLQQVHDEVLKTATGKQAAQVLGVSDEANVRPINLGNIAANAVLSVRSAAQKRVQTMISAQIIGFLAGQFEKLPESEKQQLRQIVCTASSSSGRAVDKCN